MPRLDQRFYVHGELPRDREQPLGIRVGDAARELVFAIIALHSYRHVRIVWAFPILA